MRKFLFALPALLALTVCLAAEPTRPPAEDGHAAISLRLALELAKAAPVKAPDPFVSPAHKTCDCADTGVCSCGADCACPNCVARKAGPKIGDTKVTDDANRPWTYGYGREYGYDEPGWYRPAKVAAPAPQPVRYYAPVMSSFAGGCSSGG